MRARLLAPSAAQPSTFASTLTSSHQARGGAGRAENSGAHPEALVLRVRQGLSCPPPSTWLKPLLSLLLQGFASLSLARRKFGTRSSC